MMISSTTEASSAATTTKATQKKGMGKDDFMKLLVAQLEHQDPMEPMKGTDFTAQLAQFSTVEQMYNMNDTLQGIKSGNTDLYASMAVNMIGKQVEAQGNEIYINSGGSSAVTFELMGDASDVNVQIFDADGRLVAEIPEGNLKAGRNEVAWNGLNSDGEKVPQGTYSYNVKAFDADGQDVASSLYTVGAISGITYGKSNIFATVGNSKVPLNTIKEIKQKI